MRKLYVLTILGSIGISACGGEDDPPGPGPGAGGNTATGGTGTGGTSTGGTSTGGIKSTGGTSTGGTSTGGTSGGSGGAKATGGSGGIATTGGSGGGKATGGAGGSTGGSKATGGAGGSMGGGKATGGAGGSTGGVGGGGTGGAGTATFKAVAAIIETNCTTGDCHGNSSNHTIFDMPATLRTTLLGMPGGSKGMNGTCMDETLVVPSMPEKSLLYNIVNANPPCAARMPYMCGMGGNNPACLKASDIQTIRDWIMAGAPE
jgi:hypothetical protein